MKKESEKDQERDEKDLKNDKELIEYLHSKITQTINS